MHVAALPGQPHICLPSELSLNRLLVQEFLKSQTLLEQEPLLKHAFKQYVLPSFGFGWQMQVCDELKNVQETQRY
jgi:hypothetical protein